MHILSVLLPILLLVAIIRIITLPLRLGRRYGGYREWDGGYNPYRYGRFGRFGGLGTILALVALDRIFGGRRF